MTIRLAYKSAVTKWANEATAKTAALTIGSERNRIVIGVCSVGETLESTPTFNGVAMTLAKEQYLSEAGYARIYYMLDADLPAPGTYNFSVDPSSATYGCMACYYIYNAKQQAPEATAGATGSSANPQSYVTTLTNNAMIVDCLVTIGGVSGTRWTNADEYFDDYSVSRGFCTGSKVCPATGSNFIGWTLSSSSNYSHALAAFEPASGLDDAYTKSLHHFWATDTFTLAPDESGKVWTLGGNAQIDSLYWRMGRSCLLLDGAGDYAETTDHADFDVGSSDFTVECWFKKNNNSVAMCAYGQINSSATLSTASILFYVDYDTANHPGVAVYSGSTPYVATSSTAITDTNWHHLAAVRNGNTLYLYLDGTQVASVSVTGVTVNNSSNKPTLGRPGEYASQYMNGWIDEFRFSNGIARYTTAFTPQWWEFGQDNPSDHANTIGLFHFFGDSGSYMMYNSAGLKQWIASVGLDQTQYAFRPGALKSSSITTHYMYPVGDADTMFNWPGDFTVDFRIRFSSLSGAQIFYDGRPASTTNWYVTLYKDASNYIKFFSNGADRITGNTVSVDTWYHIALCKSGSSTKLFMDGTQVGSTYTDTNTYLQAQYRPLVMGDGYAVTNGLLGWMDELHIMKGTALYTSNFTPPTVEYGAAGIFATINGVNWANWASRNGVAIANYASLFGVDT